MKWPPNDLDALLRRAAEVLKRAGAQEVYAFGSAVRGKMHEFSDVDLAVSGLPPKLFFSTLAEVSEIFERSVDLVDLDVGSPFTDYLKEEGELQRVA